MPCAFPNSLNASSFPMLKITPSNIIYIRLAVRHNLASFIGLPKFPRMIYTQFHMVSTAPSCFREKKKKKILSEITTIPIPAPTIT